MKITVLTPSYNDASSIRKTLDSLFAQTNTNWESIIIDDGSTDNTKEIIEEYKKEKDKENKIKYIYQENQDQLNALLNGMNYITGDYIFTLHSDDLLPSDDFFEKALAVMEKEPNCDALMGDLIIINDNDEVTNCWKANEYIKDEETPAKLILTRGANFYGDVFFHKKEVFFRQIKENYLLWNTPIWLDLNNNAEMLNIKRVEFPLLKYRIHSGNYKNSEIGKFNLLNGELRTLTRVMKYYEIPCWRFQSALYNFLRMPIVRKLKLYNHYKIKYRKKETENKYKIIKNAIKHTYQNDYKDNKFLNAILNFYSKKVERKITLEGIENEVIYKGKDIRSFTKKLLNDELTPFYNNFLKEMQKGFSTVIVANEKEKEMAEDLLKFMCLYPFVEIKIDN